MKVNTIKQFYILQEIKKHFDMDTIMLDLVDESTIAVADKKGTTMDFIYSNGKVTWEWGDVIARWRVQNWIWFCKGNKFSRIYYYQFDNCYCSLHFLLSIIFNAVERKIKIWPGKNY